MEPQPQLQPVNPKPAFQYAEPSPRPLELKPGRAPLDLRPRPSTRPQLDIKYGPSSPAEVAAQRANPLGNPLNVVKPVVNNPLGYAPGKGIAAAAAVGFGRMTDPETFGVPYEDFEPADMPALPQPSELPNYFSPDAIDSGPETREGLPFNTNDGGDFAAWGGLTITNRTISGQLRTRAILTYSVEPRTDFPDRKQLRFTNCAGVSSAITDFRDGSVQIVGAAACFTGQPYAPGDFDTPSERAPNGARAPFKTPAPFTAPSEVPDLGAREDGSTMPDPAPALRGTPFPGEGFVPYSPPALVPVPEIKPVNPELPAAPAKFPPPATAPTMPGEFTDPDRDDPARKLKPPFLPVLPGTTPPEIIPPAKTPPIIVFIPPLRRDDCCADVVVMRESQRIRDRLDDIIDGLTEECTDLCNEAQLFKTYCDEEDGQQVVRTMFETVTTLSQALGFLSREIADIKALLNPCGPPVVASVIPAVLASGTMNEGNNVAYVAIAPAVRQVELIITGTIPNQVRLYDTTLSGEQQGKFGAITLAYPGVTGGNAPDAFHQWAWTRRTSFYVGQPIRNDRRIRINLKSGLSWILYDTGLRS